MAEQVFSPVRSKAARKPWPICPDIVIYRCSHCGRLYQGLDYDVPAEEPNCCKTSMEKLTPLNVEDLTSAIDLEYKIVGGHNQNAIQVFWKVNNLKDKPEWILLKTFTGSYIKYVHEKKVPPMVFAMADEDAYVYCDEETCLQCVFRCKKGFIAYAYFQHTGLVAIPFDKSTAQY